MYIGNKSIFVRNTSKSNSDITRSDQQAAEKIRHWQIMDEETLNEHRYFSFKISSENKKLPRSFSAGKG